MVFAMDAYAFAFHVNLEKHTALPFFHLSILLTKALPRPSTSTRGFNVDMPPP
jgi:hypothetical protein